VRQWAAAQLGGEQAAEGQTARLAFENGMRSLLVMRRLTPEVSCAGAKRRAPTGAACWRQLDQPVRPSGIYA
jgi:hypothetical protein